MRDLPTRLDALAAEWMRNEERSADYQDGLADAAEQLRTVLADHAETEEASAEPEVCVHCGGRLTFNRFTVGEWSHLSGSTYCQDKGGFTKTPLSVATPTYYGTGSVL